MPVRAHFGVSEFLRLGSEWLIGSPHRAFDEDDFDSDLGPGALEEITVGNECLLRGWLQAQGTCDWAGQRHSWTDQKGATWITDFGYARTENGGEVAIRLHCSQSGPNPRLPASKPPYLLKLLERADALDSDGPLTIGSGPRYLREEETDLAEMLLSGGTEYLPVVYLSAVRWGSEPPCSAALLARQLRGMAHVVVEPSRQFSLRLRAATGGTNPYLGAAGIHWPRIEARPTRLLPSLVGEGQVFHDEVVSIVSRGMLNAWMPDRLDWHRLRSQLSIERIEGLHSQGEKALDEYAEAFDREVAALKAALADRTDEVGRLRAQLDESRIRPRSGPGVLTRPNIQDYYENEVLSIVVGALTTELERRKESGRSAEVLRKLLDENHVQCRDWEREIKVAFKGYRRLERKQRKLLSELGFCVEEDRRHVRLIWNGDERYAITIPTTSSDHRSGQNIAAEIIRLLR